MFGVLRAEGYSERAIFVIDTEGIVRYVDVHDIDEQPDNDELMKVLEGLDPWPGRQPAAQPVQEVSEPTPVEAAQVTLYCTPWCPACRRARAFLKDKGVQFNEIDISRDRDSARQVRAWANGSETTPTIKINDEVIVDFKAEQVERLEKLLGSI